MRTDVTITVDTEFSIAGAFDDFKRHKPLAEEAVYCAVNGRSQGLGFLLDVFQHYGIDATFFVEAINVRYFGNGRMGDIAERIAAAEQDLQLHVHPCWAAFRDGGLPAELHHARNDSCAGREAGELRDIIQTGIDAFAAWDLPRPVALRTGSFFTDRNVFRVMRDLDLPLASNICTGVHRPREAALHLTGGRHFIEGVMELPVLSFEDMPRLRPGHLRPLQVTACSLAEIKSVLWAARDAGVENVVILTHPFEYVKKKDFRYRRLTRNRVNQRRLAGLCAFLKANERHFRAVSFGRAGEEWLSRGATPQPQIRSGLGATVARMAENKINDLIWAY